MYRPQKLVAALFSAALLCTTGIALADKGGNHDKHGGSSAQSAPGSSNNSNSKAPSQRGPGGMGGPQSGPGSFDRGMARSNRADDGTRGGQFEGNVDAAASKRGSMDARAAINVKLSNGATRSFDISQGALKSLKEHDGRSNLIFFTGKNGEITAISSRGEKDNMRVVARSGDTFTLQDKNGQERLISLDAKTANRLHVKVGCNLQVTTDSATSGKIVALDLEKKHGFDKFSRKSDVDVAKLDADHQKVDFDTRKLDVDRARAKSKADMDVAKLDMDRRDVDIDQEKLDIDKSRGKKADVDRDQQKLDADRKKCDEDVATADIDRAKTDIDTKAKKAKKADVDVVKADIDTVKSDIDNGKTKKSKKLERDVAKLDNDQRKLDMDVANGGCGRSSSRSGNPAFANQMAKDAANDISGHNPPGLPHECVNPAGHTRGFCKSSSSESMCGGSGNGGGENEVASSPSKPCAPSDSSKSRSNPAFANQKAKDRANDISGHNPPGLPHECVNPAGHTRGFCKTRESESSAMCGGSSGGGIAPSDLHGGIARGSALAPGTAAAPVNGGHAIARTGPGGFTPSGSGTRGPGSPVGFIPVGGGSYAPSGTRGPSAAGGPTHVLGASTGPTRGRHVAALPARVLPVAIQPVGKRRCVWYKTGVLGASTGPYRIYGTSANGGKVVLHKKCR